MKKIKEHLKLLKEIKDKLVGLKLWLGTKEIEAYYEWKEENVGDRTAMDKVIAVLKLKDTEWVEKEYEYAISKTEYEMRKYTMDFTQSMLNSKLYTADDIDEVLDWI